MIWISVKVAAFQLEAALVKRNTLSTVAPLSLALSVCRLTRAVLGVLLLLGGPSPLSPQKTG